MVDLFPPVLNHAAALFLAFVMLGAAWHKLNGPAAFRDVLLGYALLPGQLIGPAQYGLPVLELGAGILLLPSATRPAGALLAAGLLAVYLCAMAANLLRGRSDLDCGCSMQGNTHSLGGADLLRNTVLILICAAITGPPPPMPGLWINWLSAAGIASVAIIVYFAIDQLQSNAQRLVPLHTVHSHD